LKSSNLRVAIYCRLSEEDKNKNTNTDSESIQNQKSMLINYAVNKNWEIFNIYSDDDYTGSDRNRPEFKKLLLDAEKRKFDVVLCKSQSRFTREMELVEKYIHGKFLVWNIRFIGITDNADTSIDGNKKSRQINGLVNEWFLEDMSNNIKSVLTNKRLNGQYIGSFALYGYKKDPNQKGHLIIDKPAADVVRLIFEMFSNWMGKFFIVKYLNLNKILSPSEYKSRNCENYININKKSGLWSLRTVMKMLTNEMYIGNMIQNTSGTISYKSKKKYNKPKNEWIIVKNTHEPIISKDLWDKVQNIINKKYKSCNNGNIGVFAGKLKCMNCGNSMISSYSCGKKFFRCKTKYFSKDSCVGAYISQEKLEKIVIHEFKLETKKYLNKQNLTKNIILNKNLTQKKQDLEFQISKLKQELKSYESFKKDLYLDKLKKIITDDDFVKYSQDFNQKEQELNNLILKFENKIEFINNKFTKNFNKENLISEYSNIDKLTRETIDKLIDFILIGKKNKIEKTVPINIYWNF